MCYNFVVVFIDDCFGVDGSVSVVFLGDDGIFIGDWNLLMVIYVWFMSAFFFEIYVCFNS